MDETYVVYYLKRTGVRHLLCASLAVRKAPYPNGGYTLHPARVLRGINYVAAAFC